ncbi:hypothetical protein RSOLAG1IB_09451 [Rhizoctonia solani AG-1 IB]|uniref:Uncharacterized protein n=1 Tax=Thanatephorus cucumeris (strain AG1-IB / isolate 7/3/14) TaxID=1108050 RepID=A0A0B7FVE5_THACB|nr:hypothetical protein RSOLAG1IB_09451 [Rhizoctonia solani AG-1 IB]
MTDCGCAMIYPTIFNLALFLLTTPVFMGKSAKLHKRPRKGKVASSSTSHAKSQSNPVAPSTQSQPTKPKADKAKRLKSKPSTSGRDGHVLGGADYVTLMMGGRAKAKEEALKLPVDED